MGLAGLDTVEAMQAFVDRHALADFPHLIDEEGDLWERFGIISQPAWVFVDDDGTARTVSGSLSEDGLREEIDRLRET